MPLLDHFRPPLSLSRGWPSLHAVWCVTIVERLNGSVLPAAYVAEAEVNIGSRVEVDVATLEREESPASGPGNRAVATVAATYAPPVPALEIPAVFPDEIEVLVLGDGGGARVVAAVEMISPSNKDRPETRRAFAAKCAAYLQVGIGLVVVDIVTDRLSNLHDELMTLMDPSEPFRKTPETPIYAVAYRPTRRGGVDRVDCWPYPLRVGETLPTVPFALRGGPTVPLDLEATYMESRRRSRL